MTRAREESPYSYFARTDVVAEYAEFDFLLEPERRIFEELKDTLQGARILDLGVGAGRTAIHLVPLARRYVGIDISGPMIEACQRRFGDQLKSDQVSFRQGDVRDLRSIPDDSFDFVLFSFNGLDVVGDHEERLKVLREVARVCDVGARFCFSSHNLWAAKQGFSITSNVRRLVMNQQRWRDKLRLVAQPKTIARTIMHPLRWRRLNAWKSIGSSRHAQVIEERPRYEFIRECYDTPSERIRVEKYYIRPDEQVEQLNQFGLGNVRVFTADGQEVTGALTTDVPESWWLYYIATAEATLNQARTVGGLG